MYALSIEYQMADLAQTLNRLASGGDSVSLLATDTSVHDLTFKMFIERNQDSNILTIKVVLYDRNNEEVTAPHDIGIQIGMFADFLTPYQSDFYTDDNMPGGN